MARGKMGFEGRPYRRGTAGRLVRAAAFNEGVGNSKPGFLRCLSVRQPWAGLLVFGPKDVENRSWSMSRYEACLIHAGKTVDEAAYDDPRVRKALEELGNSNIEIRNPKQIQNSKFEILNGDEEGTPHPSPLPRSVGEGTGGPRGGVGDGVDVMSHARSFDSVSLPLHSAQDDGGAAPGVVDGVGVSLREACGVTGAVIGGVYWEVCRREVSSEWHEEGLWGWYRSVGVGLLEPVACRGKLGFFDVAESVALRGLWSEIILRHGRCRRNSKSEILNPKQIQNSNGEILNGEIKSLPADCVDGRR